MPAAKPKFEIDLKHLQNNPLSHPQTSAALLTGPATPRPPLQTSASSASSLLSLSQDITALVSLSIEATASLVNDYVRAALGTIGAGELVRHSPARGTSSNSAGLAVVVVGAADSTGQSLTLRLAKSGYTVFPFVPASSRTGHGVAPAASPLSALLLAWSGVQRRLKARDPAHSGAVIPVVIDDAAEVFLNAHAYTTAPPSPPKRAGRFADAADTVRAYCRENRLVLVSIVSAAPATIRAPADSYDGIPHTLMSPPAKAPFPSLSPCSLTRTDEEALISLYRTYVLDPLSVVRALGDLLASPPGSDAQMKGRVLFVETNGTVDDIDPTMVSHSGAAQVIAAARAEAARVLRRELGTAGISVCEIVVGPMAPRIPGPVHLRSSSGDSDTDKSLAAYQGESTAVVSNADGVLTSRVRLLARIFAVDDALLYSCVRRAIEDRYPRARHNAGLAPLLASVANATPGFGMARFLGRWVLGRLFAPRQT